MSTKDAHALIQEDQRNADVLFPYMIANDLLGDDRSQPSRYVIDFGDRDMLEANRYSVLFERVKEAVLSDREAAAEKEARRNKEAKDENPDARLNHHHANFLKRWWQLSYRRSDMMGCLQTVPRYICCARVTKRPIFEFISTSINPGDALAVFPMPDDYSFGILQSSLHWSWFTERCSTLTERYRYTSNTVFDSFPWPQEPDKKHVLAVAKAARSLYTKRRALCEQYGKSLRELYRDTELPGAHALGKLQDELDAAVRKAYGMRASDDPLKFLFELNQRLHAQEASAQAVQAPGLPEKHKALQELVGEYAVHISED